MSDKGETDNPFSGHFVLANLYVYLHNTRDVTIANRYNHGVRVDIHLLPELIKNLIDIYELNKK